MTRATTTRKRSTTTARKTSTTARTAPAAVTTTADSTFVAPSVEVPADATAVSPIEGAAEKAATAETGSELRKADLIDQVVAASGVKKKFAKPVIEAALAILGNSLSEGKTVNLQPLGKLMVTDKRDKENGEVLITRIRRSQQSAEQAVEEVKTPLADPGEDS